MKIIHVSTHSVSKEVENGENPETASIPQTVWRLGLMMLLANLSYVMIYSYCGIYLKNVLAVSTTLIGVIEGVAEAASYIMKLFSGMFSDYLRRRKPVMIVGYTLIVVSRVIFSLASAFTPIFLARLIERLGNGIQSTPRDTLVADVTPVRRIGAAYGLKRTLAQAGSFVGGICGLLAMIYFQDEFLAVFKLAAVPSLLAFCILLFLVKEPRQTKHSAVSAGVPQPEQKKKHPIISWRNFPLLGRSFWLLMLVAAIFMLSRFGETFMILHANRNFGLEDRYASVIMIVFNAGWCLSAYPVGMLADRMNRYWFLIMGVVFLVLADLLMASATSLTMVMIGVAFWGVQYGVTQNIFMSLIAEIVPHGLRGTGFGCYYIICATSAFFADLLAGSLADHYGEATAFISSGVIASVSLLVLIVIMGYKQMQKG